MADRRGSWIWGEPSEDRRRAGLGMILAIAVAMGVSFRTAVGALPVPPEGRPLVDLSVLTAVIAVVALRSVPLRYVVRAYALVGAGLLLRFGLLRSAPVPVAALDVIVWVVSTSIALALCPTPSTRSAPSARSTPSATGPATSPASLPSAIPASGSTASERTPRVSRWASVRLAVAATAVVAAVVLLVGPSGGRIAPAADSSGGDPDELDSGPQNPLSVQERLDMTRRPRLTDALVMTVRSDIVSFWRTATFDEWDGTTWTSTDGGTYTSIGPQGSVIVAADDVAASLGDESTQEFRLESRFANALPVAPSPSRVQSSARLLQRPDGSVVAPDALGAGATYTVTSRQMPVTAAQLSTLPTEIPADVLDRYASSPETTERVRALARQIVTEAGADTELAKVQAIEAWMGANLEYSLDAPLSPEGVDVVDHFLFESKLGWCEQIASSLVVMLREVGVPARLATGFAPGEQDGDSGRFIVRERDAHAWAEVWFPDVGWIPFDPTADVPLAADAATSDGLPIGFVGLAVLLLFVGVVAVLAVPLARRLHAWRQRRAMRRAADRLAAERWDVRVERELEELGREAGRPRAPAESVATYGRELAAVTGRSELAEQGQAVDDFRYRPPES